MVVTVPESGRVDASFAATPDASGQPKPVHVGMQVNPGGQDGARAEVSARPPQAASKGRRASVRVERARVNMMILGVSRGRLELGRSRTTFLFVERALVGPEEEVRPHPPAAWCRGGCLLLHRRIIAAPLRRWAAAAPLLHVHHHAWSPICSRRRRIHLRDREREVRANVSLDCVLPPCGVSAPLIREEARLRSDA